MEERAHIGELISALVYLYGSARRRLKLGLCDPLVCNRYWLWGFLERSSPR
jgi:hypothetical protein